MKLTIKNGRISINGGSFAELIIEVKDGEVTVEGMAEGSMADGDVTVHGNVYRLETVTGAVIAHNVGNVRTESGNLRCDTVSGSVRTVSGKVACDAIGGGVRALNEPLAAGGANGS
jgi:DUF4097 and DUF4098 domain-containing protein YvlB